jgi:hypothetical protein
MIEIDLDAVAEHARDLIWDQLREELELVTCQQGCPEQVRSPQDLADAVPAVLIDPPKWSGGRPEAEGLPALEGTVTIGITFIRPIAPPPESEDDPVEEHPRELVKQLQKIAALFSRPDFKLEGWDDGAGLDIQEIYPADLGHDHDLTYEDSTVRLALGSITLQARAIVYDPAG